MTDYYRPCAGCDSVNDSCRATGCPATQVYERKSESVANQTCRLCGRREEVVPDGRGFPPDIAKRRLIKLCKADGCRCAPFYAATVVIGPRPCGQEVKPND